MQDREHKQAAVPLDIPDAAPAAKKPTAGKKPAARPRPQGTKPQGTRPQGTKPQAAKAPAGKKPVKKAVKKQPAKKPAKKNEDDLPPWLAAIVDWCMDVPGKLKKLPGKFKKLWGSWFYRIYFPLVALAVIGIIIGCNWLRGFAADYEAAQPVHVADQVAKLFTDGDYASLYPLDTAALVKMLYAA